MAFTKIVGAGIHTLSNVHTHNVNSSGIITATQFIGPITGGGGNFNAGIVTATSLDVNGNGDISGNLVIGGNLTANGDFTTLNTTLREVEILRVDANTSEPAGIITQTGAGDLLRLYDNTTEVFKVADGGAVSVLATGDNKGLRIHTNSGVSATANVLRFNTAQTNGFSFCQNSDGTSSGERFRIAGNGRVGIGTEIPEARLEVVDTSGLGIISRSANTQSTDTNKGLKVRNNSTTDTFNVSYKGQGYFAGNVGIGTDNPSRELTLYSPDSGSTYINLTNATTGTANNDGFGIGLSGNEEAKLWNYENTDMQFATNSTQHMTLASTGQLGIGTNFDPAATSKKLTLKVDSVGDGIWIGNAESLYPAASTGYSDIRFTFRDYLTGGFTNGGEAIVRGYNESAYATHRRTALIFMTSSAATSGNATGTATEKFRITSYGSLEQKAYGGNNKLITQRTDTASSNNDIFFQLLAKNTGGVEVGSLSFQRESAADDAYLAFNTRNTGGSLQERLRIQSNGKLLVGIHTTSEAYTWSPRARFAVEGSGDASSIHLGVRYGGGVDPAIMMLRRGGSTAWTHHVGRIYTNHEPSIYFQTSFAAAPGSENFQTHMVMKHNVGVGINSTTPTEALEVRGNIFARGATSSDKARIKFGFTNGVIQSGKTEGNVGSDYLAISGNGGSRDDLVVSNSGGVGINTSSSTIYGKLMVNSGTASNSATEYYGQDFAINIRSDLGPDVNEEGNGICFSQRWYTDSADIIRTGAIIGYKNSGNGAFGGGLKFKVQQAGASSLSTAMQMQSDGRVIVNGILKVGDAIQHNGDENTQIRFGPAATDEITIDTSGTGRMMFKSDGRVVIGGDASGTQPSATVGGAQFYGGSYPGDFRISSGAGASGTNPGAIAIMGSNHNADLANGNNYGAALNLYNYNTNDGNSTAISFHNSNGLASSRVLGHNESHSSRTGNLVFMTSDGSHPIEKARLTHDGKFGIGTNDPSNDLTVKAPASRAHSSIAVHSSNASTKATFQTVQDSEIRLGGTSAGHPLQLYAGGSAQLTIGATGGFQFHQGNANAPTSFNGGGSGARNYVQVKAGNATSGHYSGFGIVNSSSSTTWQFQVEHNGDDLDIFGNSAGGRLRFWTKDTGASSSYIRMQLTEDGLLDAKPQKGNTSGSAYNMIPRGRSYEWNTSNLSPSIGSSSNGWYTIMDVNDGMYLFWIGTSAHTSALVSVCNGYDNSRKSSAQLLQYCYNSNSTYLNVHQVRVLKNGHVQVYLEASNPQYFGMYVQVIGNNDHPNFNQTLTKDTSSPDVDHTIDIKGEGGASYDGLMIARNLKVQHRLLMGTSGSIDMGFGPQVLTVRGGNTAGYDGTAAAVFGQTDNDTSCMLIYGSDTSYGSNLIDVRVARSGSSSYNFAVYRSSSAGDNEFIFRGDGNALQDGGTTFSTPADYAEMFEWSDGNSANEDRRGMTVVLDGNKVKVATSSDSTDNIIGVVSGNPAVVGDGAWNKWAEKYLKDDFNNYILDSDGHRQLNSSYDSTKVYTPRAERQEWDAIGMVGKLRIRKGQQTGTRWIKMRDISDTVEEWLVR